MPRVDEVGGPPKPIDMNEHEAPAAHIAVGESDTTVNAPEVRRAPAREIADLLLDMVDPDQPFIGALLVPRLNALFSLTAAAGLVLGGYLIDGRAGAIPHLAVVWPCGDGWIAAASIPGPDGDIGQVVILGFSNAQSFSAAMGNSLRDDAANMLVGVGFAAGMRSVIGGGWDLRREELDRMGFVPVGPKADSPLSKGVSLDEIIGWLRESGRDVAIVVAPNGPGARYHITDKWRTSDIVVQRFEHHLRVMAPGIDTLPDEERARMLTLSVVAAINYETKFARLGVDLDDGEVRIEAIVRGDGLDSASFAQVLEEVERVVAVYDESVLAHQSRVVHSPGDSESPIIN
jgi:hypothetical protein